MAGNKDDEVIPFQPIRWPSNQIQRRTISIQRVEPGTFGHVRGCTPEGAFAVQRIGLCRQEPTKSGARNRSAVVRVFEVLHVDTLRWFHEALVTYPVPVPQHATPVSPIIPKAQTPSTPVLGSPVSQHVLRPIGYAPAPASQQIIMQSPAMGMLQSPTAPMAPIPVSQMPLSIAIDAHSPVQSSPESDHRSPVSAMMMPVVTLNPEPNRADCYSPLAFAAARLGATFAEWSDQQSGGALLPLPVVLYAHELFGSAHRDVVEQVQRSRDPRVALERCVRQAHGDALVNVVRFGAARAILLRALRSGSLSESALSPLFEHLWQSSNAAKHALSEHYWLRLREFCMDWAATTTLPVTGGAELLDAGCL